MKIDSTNQGAGPDSLQLSKAAQAAGQTQAAEAAKAEKAAETAKAEKAAEAGKAAGAGKAKAAAAGAGYGGDQVQLSNLSEALRAQNEDTPERVAYLEKLSRQVAGGEYKPDAEQIAKRMVDDLLGGI
jgi:anti-sigma28 factor (negative regulator of flagellin synthesis)